MVVTSGDLTTIEQAVRLYIAQAEKAVRAEILKGTSDEELINGFQRIMPTKKRRKSK